MADRSGTVFWHDSSVQPNDRQALLGQSGGVLWFTGLSGSGKSTLARGVEARLIGERRLAYVLDGDNVRHGLNGDLGFSAAHRAENIRRLGHVAALFADCGVICLVAAISPYRAGRQAARQAAGAERFIEVHVSTPVAICEERDTKGLYARARTGELPEFTGVSAPYEVPEHADLTVDTSVEDFDHAVERIVGVVVARWGGSTV